MTREVCRAGRWRVRLALTPNAWPAAGAAQRNGVCTTAGQIMGPFLIEHVPVEEAFCRATVVAEALRRCSPSALWVFWRPGYVPRK